MSVSRGPVKGTISQRELLAQSARSVAVVETDVGRGMGFVIDADGYIITNRHVVEDAEHVTRVWFPAQDPPVEYQAVRIVYADPARDLALLHVDSAEPLPSLPLATSQVAPIRRYVHEKDPIVLFKHRSPGEAPPVLGTDEIVAHNGAVSSLAVYNPAAGPGAFVGVTIKVQRGQSGGPVLDRHGRAVGVVTWTWKDRVGGYAIPISEAMRMLQERPDLDTHAEHEVRAKARTRQFLSALGRGDVENVRRLTSPSHARAVRAAAMEQIMAGLDREGMPVLHGFFAAVETLIEVDEAERFDRLREVVARTGTPQFRDALGLDPSTQSSQVMSFFLELGQAYLVARLHGGQSPEEAFETALMRLQTIDAARTFALARFLEELGGSQIEIEDVQVLPGTYTPRAIVTLKRRPSARTKLMQRYGVQFEPGKPKATTDLEQLTLHMKLEWGDWYVAHVARTPLSRTARAAPG